VYPKGQEENAQRIQKQYANYYEFSGENLGTRNPHISLILTDGEVEGNGFVAMAPFYTSWATTPIFNNSMGSTDWLTDLMIHEFRHVSQGTKVKQGTAKILKVFFGEYGELLANIISMPRWFAEGDAVVHETLYTDGGRGRYPGFGIHYKALLYEEHLSGRKFNLNFETNLLGSYKRYIPDHYQMGYFLSVYMRKVHGLDYFDRVLNYSSNTFNMYAFYKAVHVNGAKELKQYYSEMINDLRDHWRGDFSSFTENETTLHDEHYKNKDDYSSYYYPTSFKNSIIALKMGLDQNPSFVQIKEDSEKVLWKPAINRTASKISITGNLIVYSQKSIHHRWANEQYSDIAVFDIENGYNRTITNNKRYYHPIKVNDFYYAIKRKESRFVIVKIDNLGKEIDQEILEYGITPSDLVSDGKGGLYYIEKNLNGDKSIYNLNKKIKKLIVNIGTFDLGNLYYSGDLFFDGPFEGRQVIFKLNTHSKKITRLTNHAVGSFTPTMGPNAELLYSNYTAQGLKVYKLSQFSKLDFEEFTGASYFKTLDREDKFKTKRKTILNGKGINVKSSKYKDSDEIRYHSWTLLFPLFSTYASFDVTGTNLLNTKSLTAGYAYNVYDNEQRLYTSYSYSKYYPVFDLDFTAAKRKIYDDEFGEDPNLLDEWNEGRITFQMRIPYLKIKNNYLIEAEFYMSSNLIQVSNRNTAYNYELNSSTLTSNEVGFSWNRYTELSSRSIYPKYSQSFEVNFKDSKSIAGDDFEGRLFNARARYFIPGARKHHSVYFEATYEKQLGASDYQYSSDFVFARGYSVDYHDEIYSTKLNYTAPVASLEVNWSDWVYWKRIYMNLFYDLTRGTTSEVNSYYRSYGLEAMFEFNIFRLEFPMSFGLRLVRSVNTDETNTEFFLLTEVGSF
ncbi:MAG: hypothetical protein ACI9QD_001035, partial [Thermoproteota archaeon]